MKKVLSILLIVCFALALVAQVEAWKGHPGPRGPRGKTGPAGPQGPAGEQGAAGAAGKDATVSQGWTFIWGVMALWAFYDFVIKPDYYNRRVYERPHQGAWAFEKYKGVVNR